MGSTCLRAELRGNWMEAADGEDVLLRKGVEIMGRVPIRCVQLRTKANGGPAQSASRAGPGQGNPYTDFGAERGRTSPAGAGFLVAGRKGWTKAS